MELRFESVSHCHPTLRMKCIQPQDSCKSRLSLARAAFVQFPQQDRLSLFGAGHDYSAARPPERSSDRNSITMLGYFNVRSVRLLLRLLYLPLRPTARIAKMDETARMAAIRKR
jgi:hypothetical protein